MTYIDPQQKIFLHLDKLAALQAGKTPPPINVEIDLSNRCSHGCSWCHFAYTHTRGPLAGKRDKPADAVAGGDLMDLRLAERILDQLKHAGVKSVTWTGGGEPTLHPDFNRIIRYGLIVGLEQGLYTHGGHIDEERAWRLKQYMTWVYVSLDECTRETFKVSKGVDRFDNVLDGVRRLVAADGSATIGLGFLLHSHNFNQVARMVNLGRELGVDYVQFRPIIQYDQNAPNQLAENTTWVSWAIGHLNAYADDPFVIADADRFRRYQKWQGHGYEKCYFSSLQTVITPNGKVWRCVNKRENPDALLGDLSTEGFKTIWARNGGPCNVDSQCRIACRGDQSNQTLDAVMKSAPHANFI